MICYGCVKYDRKLEIQHIHRSGRSCVGAAYQLCQRISDTDGLQYTGDCEDGGISFGYLFFQLL